MDTKEMIKYFYEVVTSNLLLDEVADYVSDDCTVRMGETVTPMGIDGMKRHLADVRKTYPDLKMKIIRQYQDGDCVISEFVAEGTHQGQWLGLKPCGKKLTFTGVDIDKIADGKIIEHGGAMNTFETLFEAGVVRPAP